LGTYIRPDLSGQSAAEGAGVGGTMPLKMTYAVIALVMACVGFQLFFRYQYVSAANFVWRIDRLTGTLCEIRDCDYYWSFGPHLASQASPQP
jgi:hypothetical protein